MLKTIVSLREAETLDEARFKHFTAAHRKALLELQRSVPEIPRPLPDLAPKKG